MIQKKANVSIYFIIGGLIALVVLIVSLSPGVREMLLRPLNIIPDYNNTKPPVQTPELVRYSINEDKVQYYDGLNWLEFPADWNQKIKIGQKDISHSQSRYNFARYYYKSPRAKETQERIIDLQKDSNFQNEIKSWYSQAGTWESVSPAAPFNAIIRQIGESPPNLGVVNIDLVSGNYFAEPGSPQTNLTLGPIEAADSSTLSPKGFHFFYKNGIKTGVLISDPPEVYGEGLIFVFIYGKDHTKFEQSKTMERIGYLKKDQTGKYRVYIYSDSGKPTGITTAQTNAFGAEQQVSVDDYNIVYELLNGNYYMEDLKEKFKENQITNKKVYGKFYLDSSNVLKFDKLSKDQVFLEGSPSGSISKDNPLYASIVPGAIAWRDSIFSSPMCFCFTSTTDCALLDVQKLSANSQVYLVTDLNKPKGTCSQVSSS